jgi:hypothetical protein
VVPPAQLRSASRGRRSKETAIGNEYLFILVASERLTGVLAVDGFMAETRSFLTGWRYRLESSAGPGWR